MQPAQHPKDELVLPASKGRGSWWVRNRGPQGRAGFQKFVSFVLVLAMMLGLLLQPQTASAATLNDFKVWQCVCGAQVEQPVERG